MTGMESITVVGAGRVGQALGGNLAELGHPIRYAVREMAGSRLPPGATAIPIEGAAHGAAVTLLAVPFATVGEVVPRLGLASGQLLVDATNPFGADTAGSPSGAAVVAAAAGTEVRVVKAFNVLGAEHMSRTIQQAVAAEPPPGGPEAPLRMILAPVMVLVGSETKPFFFPMAQFVVDHVPNARIQEIPGAGHAAPLTHPEALADALAEFFLRTGQPTVGV